MEATIVDLRYKMNDVMKALNRNEEVKILYHGTVKGILSANIKKTNAEITEHPFFNMNSKDESVDETMKKIRNGRYNDI